MTFDDLDPDDVVAWDALEQTGRFHLRKSWCVIHGGLHEDGITTMVEARCHERQSTMTPQQIAMSDDYGHADKCRCWLLCGGAWHMRRP